MTLLLLGVVLGCDVGSYRVVVRFDPPGLAQAVTRMEVALLSSCETQELGGDAPEGSGVAWRRGERAPVLQRRAPGIYGLYAVGRSSDCGMVVAGCTPVEVVAGGEGELAVTVKELEGFEGCAGTQCDGRGRCVRPEPDGGGATDAERPDGGVCTQSAVVRAVSVGYGQVCAIDEGGTLYCWGSNEYGKLGTGEVGGSELVPTLVDPSSSWLDVGTGRHHTCAIRDDGALFCWGRNEDGGLGNGDRIDQGSPVQAGTRTDWSKVRLGKDHSCGLTADGSLHCWGENTYYQLGIAESMSDQTTPVLVAAGAWRDVVPGFEHTCAVDSDDTLYCWGRNHLGQLGLGDVGEHRSPEALEGQWKHVTAGRDFTCGIRLDGTLWCWGTNERGQLGLGTLDTEPHPTPEPVGTDADWAAVWAGSDFACGLRSGGLYCWGHNGSGELGIGATGGNSGQPTAVAREADWVQMGAGNNVACAIDRSGALYCWGGNGRGQLGLGDTNNRAVPEPVCIR